MHSSLRVLLVTAQLSFAASIKDSLGRGICIVRVAREKVGAQATLRAWRPHVAIIDIDRDSGQILEELGIPPHGVDRMPIIALIRQWDLETKLRAFEQGVDDVVSSSVAAEELLARVLALARRVYREAANLNPVIRTGDLEINFAQRRVLVAGEEQHLTALELALLHLLTSNAGQVLTRDEILDHVWGVEYLANSNIVDRHIHNLRAKLYGGQHHTWNIATIPGCGYCFMPDR